MVFDIFTAVKLPNVLLAIGLTGLALYELSRARFLADLQIRIVGVSITGPLSLNVTFEFMNPSNVSASINTIYAQVDVNGYHVATFQDNTTFTISPGISRKVLMGNIDPLGLLSLGLGSLKNLKRPIIASVNGYAIGGAIKYPFSQTVHV